MTDEISEEGRQARFKRWDDIGWKIIQADLESGGYRFVGGGSAVKRLAQWYVQIREAEDAEANRKAMAAEVARAVAEQTPAAAANGQSDALDLLRCIARATQGSEVPAVIEELPNMPIDEGRAKAAFQYLKGKGLIDAHFSIYYAARVSAAGHEFLAAATAPSPPVGPPADLIDLQPNLYGRVHHGGRKPWWKRLFGS